jgi:hypothetical protein
LIRINTNSALGTVKSFTKKLARKYNPDHKETAALRDKSTGPCRIENVWRTIELGLISARIKGIGIRLFSPMIESNSLAVPRIIWKALPTIFG